MGVHTGEMHFSNKTSIFHLNFLSLNNSKQNDANCRLEELIWFPWSCWVFFSHDQKLKIIFIQCVTSNANNNLQKQKYDETYLFDTIKNEINSSLNNKNKMLTIYLDLALCISFKLKCHYFLDFASEKRDNFLLELLNTHG